MPTRLGVSEDFAARTGRWRFSCILLADQQGGICKGHEKDPKLIPSDVGPAAVPSARAGISPADLVDLVARTSS